jgi:hypothetical protein
MVGIVGVMKMMIKLGVAMSCLLGFGRYVIKSITLHFLGRSQIPRQIVSKIARKSSLYYGCMAIIC